MSVNNYQPHLLVIPEDDANRQLANGFALEVRHGRRIQVLVEAGGWLHVCDSFLRNQPTLMRKFPKRHVVLLLDFDDDVERRSKIERQIPIELRSRVFLLGVRSEPEALKQAGFGTLEYVGRRLAIECREQLPNLWTHVLLRENLAELDRLMTGVKPFLFDTD